MLTASQFKDSQLSELSAAVGTVELVHGAHKRAKELFNQSLLAPTENSLAQAQWAVEQDSKIVIPATAWQTPASYEANALASRQARDWSKALSACAAWLADEPFSLRPALMGSYVGFRPEFNAAAEQFATAGLRCDNTNIALLNNRAVVRAYQGQIDGAYEDVRAALEQSTARNDAHLMATLGLIAFRSGMHAEGREYYGLSIAWFSHSKEPGSVASALLHLLREEIRIDRSAISQSINLAQRLAKLPIALRQPELIGMADLVLEEARAAVETTRTQNETTPLASTSPDELHRHASLFHVPEKAKKLLATLESYADLV